VARFCAANAACALLGFALFVALRAGLFGVYAGLLLVAALLWARRDLPRR
jgi:hypothetical protein